MASKKRKRKSAKKGDAQKKPAKRKKAAKRKKSAKRKGARTVDVTKQVEAAVKKALGKVKKRKAPKKAAKRKAPKKKTGPSPRERQLAKKLGLIR